MEDPIADADDAEGFEVVARELEKCDDFPPRCPRPMSQKP
jgi:hypothetical protein